MAAGTVGGVTDPLLALGPVKVNTGGEVAVPAVVWVGTGVGNCGDELVPVGVGAGEAAPLAVLVGLGEGDGVGAESGSS